MSIPLDYIKLNELGVNQLQSFFEDRPAIYSYMTRQKANAAQLKGEMPMAGITWGHTREEAHANALRMEPGTLPSDLKVMSHMPVDISEFPAFAIDHSFLSTADAQTISATGKSYHGSLMGWLRTKIAELNLSATDPYYEKVLLGGAGT